MVYDAHVMMETILEVVRFIRYLLVRSVVFTRGVCVLK